MNRKIFNTGEKEKISIPKGMQKRFFLIACEVMAREFMHAAAHSRNIVDIEFVSQGWHDIESSEMRGRIQSRIDRVPSDRYDATLLGFRLCNNGVVGVKAGNIPIVLPRAHDCIAILLGSHQKYIERFRENPGTYYLSSGWLERDDENLEKMNNAIMSKLGLDMSYSQYVEKYGRENADFIISQISGYAEMYQKLAFIDNNTGDCALYANFAEKKAKELKLEFQKIKSNLAFFEKLLDGDWSENDFLIIAPGEEIAADTERIMKTVKHGEDT